MAEIIDAELHFKAVFCGLPLRQRHHAGIVDQEIERSVSGGKARGEIGHRSKLGQIERLVADFGVWKLAADSLDRISTLGVIAAGEHHCGPGACERQRGLIAEATSGTGNDGGLAAEEWNVCDGPAGHAYIS